MDISAAENLETVRSSNQEILDYFNGLYVEKLEQIQSLKTEQFELKIKIDELIKTLDVYSFKNSTGHNVFSPFSTTTTTQEEKASQIEQKLNDLNEVNRTLDSRILALQKESEALKTRITSIHTATKKLDAVLEDLAEEFTEEAAPPEPEEEEVADDKPVINHGINVLRMEKYSRDKLAQSLHNNIKQQLDGTKHKLEVLSWLIKSDITRAKVTLDELVNSTNEISDSLDFILADLASNIDMNEPLWTLLDDTIFKYKEAHPECVIESDIDCPEYDLQIPEIIILNLIYILREIFDNAFKHSNANRIVIKIYISNRLIDVYMNDNGIGIDSSYNHTSPWYSGLHRIQEIIYLLNGQFNIEGDIISGTNVRFSFPIDIDAAP